MNTVPRLAVSEPLPQAEHRRAILVLGMHRAGTSAVTRLINLAGAALPQKLMPAAEGNNAEGFFEGQDYVDLHEEILTSLGSAWDEPAALPEAWFRSAEAARYRDRLVAMMAADFPADGLFVLKDPRMCRLVPLWLDAVAALGAEPAIVLPLRQPLEVAASLAKRDGMVTAKGLYLWLRHFIDAELHTRGCKRAFVRYDDVLSDWRGAMDRMGTALGIAWPKLSFDTANQIDAFLKPSLRHTIADDAAFFARADVPDTVREGWRLATRAFEDDAPELASQFDALAAAMDGIESVLGPIQAADRATIATLRHDLTGAYEGFKTKSADYDRLDGFVAGMEGELTELRASRDYQSSRLTELEAAHEALSAFSERAQAEAKGTIDTLNRQLETEKSTAKAEIGRLRQVQADLTAQAAHLQSALSAEHTARLAIYNSTSWKVTKPVRFAGRVARRLKRELRRFVPAPATHMPAMPQPGQAPAAPVSHGADPKATFKALQAARLTAFLSGGARMDFSAAEAKTAVILVLYNQAELTLACLASLKETLAEPVELVIVDNASADRTGLLLDRIDGATIVRNTDNVGFLLAVNQAVALSKAGNILLLNNDTQLLPQALEKAEATLHSAPDIGAVGGRLILLDGRLQEAGSIIWQDGTCLGYARGAAPDAPEAMFRRDVDYCSGAFLLIRRAAWDQLGGLDTAYAPAYYEETDFCLRLWEQDWRVVYEPQSAILHYEFGSAPVSDWAIAQQEKNRKLFTDRHARRLGKHRPAEPLNPLAVLKARAAAGDDRPKLLVLEDRVPHDWLGAGFPRSAELMQALDMAGAAVTFLPTWEANEGFADSYKSLPAGFEIAFGYGTAGVERHLEQRQGFYDAILVCRPHNMKDLYALYKKRPGLFAGLKIIYDAEALFSAREILQRQTVNDPLSPEQAAKIVAEEIELVSIADQVFSVSPREAATFRRNGVNAVEVLGHTLEPHPTPSGFADRRDFLFVGALYDDGTPNTDSVHWFITEIWPLIQAKIPDAKFRLVGINTAPKVNRLASESIIFHGKVEDLGSYFDAARVFIAPTRYAAGIPHKIHEAAGRGIPCVVTPLLAEQLGWESGRELMTGADAKSFAEACIAAYTDETLWNGLRSNALDAVTRDCSPAIFAETVARMVSGIARPIVASKDYPGWIAAYDTLRDSDRAAIRRHIDTLAAKPVFSIVLPVYNTPERWLRKAIESVQGQLYPHWQLCIADDASPAAHVAPILAEYAAKDSRIKIVTRPKNGHISAASNSALGLATGDFVALLDHDDAFAPHALYMMAVELNAHPGADILFSDEDKIDTDGNRYDPYFKSGVNLDLMRSYNAVNHLGVYRRALVEAAGGFREGFEGAQDYDLLLRVMDRTTPARIRHIPHILYHWRAIPGSTALSADTKDYAVDAARKALSESLHRRNMHGTVGAAAVPEWHHIRYALPEERPPVTLIIPTRDQLKLLKTAIESVERTVSWPNLEIIVVDNQSSDPATLSWLAEFEKKPNRRVIRYDAPFNYAAMNNRAAAEARGLVLGLLNNDIEALEPGWLDEMVAQALRPEIGAVGAKLFYPDRTVQHAGVLVGVKGVACHAMAHIKGDHPGFMGLNLVARNVSAVTAACLVVRREVFEQIGGFDADNLPVSYNDVDLCLKIQAAGYRNLWTPAAKLVHHESVSRGEDTRPEHRERALREYGHMQARWQKVLAADPYYNPNLTASDCDYGLAFPPRVTKPWQGH